MTTVNNPFLLKRFKRPTYNNKIRSFKFIKILLYSKSPKRRFKYKTIKPGMSDGRRICFTKRKKIYPNINVSYTMQALTNKLHTAVNITRLYYSAKFFFKIITSSGELYYLPGPVNLQLFKLYHTFIRAKTPHITLVATLFHYLYKFVVLTKISNITFNKLYKMQIAVARGSYAVLLYYDSIKSRVKITLPSKKKIFLYFLMIAFPAYINNDFLKYKTRINKHSYYKFIGKKNIVRGVAKNPVDHPNGGNTKSKPKYKTPWGKLTK